MRASWALRAVRSGEMTLSETLQRIEDAEARLRSLVEACTSKADLPAIDAFLVRAQLAHWRSRGLPAC